MEKSKVFSVVKSYVIITVASAIFALGFNWFYRPNSIAFGGMTGAAQIVHVLLPWAPVGTVVIVLNAPLFLLGWRFIGGRMLVSSLYAMAVSSLFIDLVGAAYAFEPMDPMLACLIGGTCLGLSLGMIFSQGSTTGGTDLLARLLKLKLAWLPMGKLMMAVDLVVIVATAVAFRSLNSALYGLVALTISSSMIDRVLYGMDDVKVAYIISDRSKDLLDAIIHDMDRGVTVLQGKGGYSGAEKNVLMCALKQRQIVRMKQLVKQADPDAFLIVCPAYEVLGAGFRAYSQDDL